MESHHIGGDYHPYYKYDVSLRLSYGALNFIYNIPTQYSGPYCYSCEIIENKIILLFNTSIIKNMNDELELIDKYGFEVYDGSGWKLIEINSFNENSITLISNNIDKTTSIRYIYGDNPCCREIYKNSTTVCKIKNCPFYGKSSHLPVPPFILFIENKSCIYDVRKLNNLNLF